MASIGVRQDTGKLYFNFRFRNVRCREQSDLKESPANRKRMQVALDKIQAEILLGQFDYASTFPNSQMLKKIESIAKATANFSEQVPLVKDFCELWFEENKVQWRKGYTVSVTHIIQNRIIPFFGDIQIDKVTKQQVLAFRTYICSLKKRNGDSLAPAHVNKHMKLLRAVLTEAAERFGFISSYSSFIPRVHPVNIEIT